MSFEVFPKGGPVPGSSPADDRTTPDAVHRQANRIALARLRERYPYEYDRYYAEAKDRVLAWPGLASKSEAAEGEQL